jgi:hypothetical protein
MASVGQKSRKSGPKSEIKSLWRKVATSANNRFECSPTAEYETLR